MSSVSWILFVTSAALLLDCCLIDIGDVFVDLSSDVVCECYQQSHFCIGVVNVVVGVVVLVVVRCDGLCFDVCG